MSGLYLRLEGIEGEEPVGDNSQKAIGILSYSHSLSTQFAPVRPSAGKDVLHRRSACQHGLFQVTKAFDKTSPKIFSACANGVTFKNVVVYLCRQDFNQLTKTSKALPFMSIVMSEAVIADFSYGSSGEWQMETISFRYASIGWHVDWVDPDEGDLTKLEPVGWDGILNKEAELAVPTSLKWKTGLL